MGAAHGGAWAVLQGQRRGNAWWQWRGHFIQHEYGNTTACFSAAST
jgi:hypothetical protein